MTICYADPMPEALVRLQIRRLPEGVFLATSSDLPGLVAQGRTIAETLEIASDVARRLVESYVEHGHPLPPALRRKRKGSLQLAIPIGIS